MSSPPPSTRPLFQAPDRRGLFAMLDAAGYRRPSKTRYCLKTRMYVVPPNQKLLLKEASPRRLEFPEDPIVTLTVPCPSVPTMKTGPNPLGSPPLMSSSVKSSVSSIPKNNQESSITPLESSSNVGAISSKKLSILEILQMQRSGKLQIPPLPNPPQLQEQRPQPPPSLPLDPALNLLCNEELQLDSPRQPETLPIPLPRPEEDHPPQSRKRTLSPPAQSVEKDGYRAVIRTQSGTLLQHRDTQVFDFLADPPMSDLKVGEVTDYLRMCSDKFAFLQNESKVLVKELQDFCDANQLNLEHMCLLAEVFGSDVDLIPQVDRINTKRQKL